MGEQPEHLWSFGKAVFLRARYMSAAHWVEVMNMWLDLMTTLQQEAMPYRLHKKLQAIGSIIGRFDACPSAPSPVSQMCFN